ncbi:MAG: putative siderophore transport system ATP-binding protein YusV [Phycisphaerae bacterium]|nr:putative siderophore transport system ATP-binding protein YusV [Phycisphaerae bacterium]
MNLAARSLTFSYRPAEPVLRGVDLEIGPGVTALIGPNAAGKSTLLKCLAGLLHPGGCVLLDGQDLARMPRARRCERISFMPQQPLPPAALSVFETVLLGRLDRLGWRVDDADVAFVRGLLAELDISGLADRGVGELSGGQAQMVAIAQALAREPAVLLMDEPISNLDLQHAFQILQLIRELTARRGMTTAVVMHDLNMAARFADRLCVLSDGCVRIAGLPGEVLTERTIADVYRVRARVSADEQGRPHVTPLDAL